MRRHHVTNEEKMLKWLRVDREGKLTSFTTICTHFWFMSKIKETLYNLVDAEHVRKLKSGFRANKTQREG